MNGIDLVAFLCFIQFKHPEGHQDPPVSEGEERIVEITELGDQGDGLTYVESGFVVTLVDTIQHIRKLRSSVATFFLRSTLRTVHRRHSQTLEEFQTRRRWRP